MTDKKKGFFSWFSKKEKKIETTNKTINETTESELELNLTHKITQQAYSTEGHISTNTDSNETLTKDHVNKESLDGEQVGAHRSDVSTDDGDYTESHDLQIVNSSSVDEQSPLIQQDKNDEAILQVSGSEITQNQVIESTLEEIETITGHAESIAQETDIEETIKDEQLTTNDLSQETLSALRDSNESNFAEVDTAKEKKKGFFTRLKESLVKTKQNIGEGFLSLFSGKKIDDELFESLEEQLLIADVGVETTTKIINSLTSHASRNELKDADLLYDKLKLEMSEILNTVQAPLEISQHTPFVILMVGVNGVGKTTTIGKLAKQFQQEGKKVMLAAGDTFRAAAVEQLQVWGERNNIPVIAQHTGADSASVIYDALEAAKARKADILIADTAGRLQNKSHLMDELKKIVRVLKKQDENAPHEIMLTLDASTGQNAVSQTKLFNEAVGLTGLALTKLDGTAKGGVIFSLADQFKIPVRYIGVGEKIDDLRPFDATEFIDALFEK